MKLCKKCGIIKEESEFGSRLSHNGKRYIQNACKECWKADRREYKKRISPEQRERNLSSMKRWYQEHREEELAKYKKKYKENREEILAKRRERYANDPEFRAIFERNKKKYYNENRELCAYKSRKYYDKNKNKIKKRSTEWAEENKEKVDEIQKKWQHRNKEKRKAYYILNNAIANGNIEKPKICRMCGVEDKIIDGHHIDYSKPLEVIWCCKECHALIHKEMRKKKIKPKET